MALDWCHWWRFLLHLKVQLHCIAIFAFVNIDQGPVGKVKLRAHISHSLNRRIFRPQLLLWFKLFSLWINLFRLFSSSCFRWRLKDCQTLLRLSLIALQITVLEAFVDQWLLRIITNQLNNFYSVHSLLRVIEFESHVTWRMAERVRLLFIFHC